MVCYFSACLRCCFIASIYTFFYLIAVTGCISLPELLFRCWNQSCRSLRRHSVVAVCFVTCCNKHMSPVTVIWQFLRFTCLFRQGAGVALFPAQRDQRCWPWHAILPCHSTFQLAQGNSDVNFFIYSFTCSSTSIACTWFVVCSVFYDECTQARGTVQRNNTKKRWDYATHARRALYFLFLSFSDGKAPLTLSVCVSAKMWLLIIGTKVHL